MHETLRFRRNLLARLLQVSTALAAATAVADSAGCGDDTSTTGTGGSTGSVGGPTSGSGPIHTTACFDWPQVDGGAAGAGGAGGSGGSGMAGGGAAPCPAQADAAQYLMGPTCGGSILSVDSAGTYAMGQCCYQVTEQGCVGTGRPFLVDGHALTARALPGGVGWGSPGAARPDVRALDAATRAALAEVWLADALLEHASVASFSRLSLELLAAGAPSDLVAGAHEAALDEVRHARLCFALAGAYAGESIGPGRFPLPGAVELAADLPTIAARAVEEGCVGETLAAIQAAERAAHATDPAVREALADIADDEARHAELAWRVVAWALGAGGAEVRASVGAAFARLESRAAAAGDVIAPAARALLSVSV